MSGCTWRSRPWQADIVSRGVLGATLACDTGVKYFVRIIGRRPDHHVAGSANCQKEGPPNSCSAHIKERPVCAA